MIETHLFFDIETLPTIDASLIAYIASSITPPAHMSKPETIAAWEANEKPAAILEAVAKTSLDGGLGRIASIAWAVGDDEITAGTSAGKDGYDEVVERQLIHAFFDEGYRVARQYRCPPTLVGHNIAGFDLRWLWKLAIVLGIAVPSWWPVDAKPWDADRVQDTMIMWEGVRGYISQDRLARVLGLPGKGGFDGSMVAAAWERGEFERIREYNGDDVEVARAIWKRITGHQPAAVAKAVAA